MGAGGDAVRTTRPRCSEDVFLSHQPKPRRRPHGISVARERWSPAASAVIVCAVAIAVGSLLLTTYTLSLGDPVPHRIDTAVVGNPRAHAGVVDAIEHAAGGELGLHPYPSLAPRSARSTPNRCTQPSTSQAVGLLCTWRVRPVRRWPACSRRSRRRTPEFGLSTRTRSRLPTRKGSTSSTSCWWRRFSAS